MSVDPALQCVFCKQYLVDNPRQALCGDRLCGSCFSELEQKEKEVPCPQCGQEIVLIKCFPDKAVETMVAKATVSCSGPGCTWKGLGIHYQAHVEECAFILVDCPNSASGCTERMQRSKVDQHAHSCKFSPAACEWCGKMIPALNKDTHLETDCDDVMVSCSNGCGEKCPRKMVENHLENTCQLQVRSCCFGWCGCSFQGTFQHLKQHEADDIPRHLESVSRALHQLQANYEKSETDNRALLAKVQASEGQIAMLTRELDETKSELATRTDEAAVRELREGYEELLVTVQSLQATSYDGTFVWKINEVRRRREEARTEKIVSLYSAPFYTSRFGYKLCLRVYLDGDGTGKGTHLSFFLAVMKGEYDALLSWPFQRRVTLILLDQDGQTHVEQSFRPEQNSSSFQRPTNRMNTASGCPMFAPLSVLDSASYVRDDVMFMKCKIDATGLQNN